MGRLTKIFTEKIHHLKCWVCPKEINTNDDSHRLSKEEAAQSFEDEGWVYAGVGNWLCPECFESIK